MELLLESIEHAFSDTWTMIPLLYIAYLIIEYFERKPSRDDAIFWNLQKYGPILGALLGLLPQCGFSILASMLFIQHNITMGTLIAVFVATSDEAIPILISEPSLLGSLGWLLLIKFVVAVVSGWLIDHVLFPKQKVIYFQDMPDEEEEEEVEEDEQSASACPCCYPQYSIWVSSLIRTVKIYLFVLLTSIVLEMLIHGIGEDTLSSILLSGTLGQPLIAAIFGFIPNCAATVVLCQLFAMGQLSFASLVSGLITNAGMGLVVLLRYEADKKKILQIVVLLLIIALIAGYLLLAI